MSTIDTILMKALSLAQERNLLLGGANDLTVHERRRMEQLIDYPEFCILIGEHTALSFPVGLHRHIDDQVASALSEMNSAGLCLLVNAKKSAIREVSGEQLIGYLAQKKSFTRVDTALLSPSGHLVGWIDLGFTFLHERGSYHANYSYTPRSTQAAIDGSWVYAWMIAEAARQKGLWVSVSEDPPKALAA